MPTCVVVNITNKLKVPISLWGDRITIIFMKRVHWTGRQCYSLDPKEWISCWCCFCNPKKINLCYSKIYKNKRKLKNKYILISYLPDGGTGAFKSNTSNQNETNWRNCSETCRIHSHRLIPDIDKHNKRFCANVSWGDFKNSGQKINKIVLTMFWTLTVAGTGKI